jgi:hypothetical protein
MSNTTNEIDVDQLIEERKNGTYKDPEDQLSPAPAPLLSNNGVNKIPGTEKQPEQHQWDNDLPVGPGHHSADPFAPREGKTLVWKDVNMTLVCYLFISLVFFLVFLAPVYLGFFLLIPPLMNLVIHLSWRYIAWRQRVA